MFGSEGLLTIVLALATAVAFLLLIVFGGRRGVIRTVTRSFWCPARRQHVTAEFQEEAWDGTPVAVNRCTAFSPPTAITCERLCLDPRQFRLARKRTWAI